MRFSSYDKLQIAVLIVCCIIGFGITYKFNTKQDPHDTPVLPEAGPREVRVLNPEDVSSGYASDSRREAELRLESVLQSVEGDKEAEIELKARPHALTYKENTKIFGDRLTREEINAAPIAKVLDFVVNGKETTVILVEKDGYLYDSSDGVAYYYPIDVQKTRETGKISY